MKKLFAPSFRCTTTFAAPAARNLLKLWHLGMAVLLATILLGFSEPVRGQAVDGTLLGTVTDSSGAVVSGASVTIMETKTGVRRSSTTNDSGNYQFGNLPPGQYEVAVDHQGFKKVMRSGFDVLVNSDVRVDLVLQPGSASETVIVSAETPILQTDSANTGRKIEELQVEAVPLGFNRNLQGLLNLVPGTTRAHREHSAFFNAQDSLRTEVNGQSGLANNLEFEGLNDTKRTGRLAIYIPPIEAVETVDVTTSNYDAELGRANGAATNVILKSGTNGFHGAAYEYNRISALAAVPFFQTIAKTPSVYNYYGANIGGADRKNKTLLFRQLLRLHDPPRQRLRSPGPPSRLPQRPFNRAP